VHIPHAIRVLDRSGDHLITWDPADAISTAEARGRFGELVRLGYLTYDASENPVVTREFDPAARLVIARKPMCAG
jgi:hypothetical protein